jgi:DNA-directed RNA polymerase subunit F
MSVSSKIKAVKVRLLSNPEALEYIEKYVEELKSETSTSPTLALRVLEYLHKFSKVPVEKAGELRRKLEELGLKEESIIMIMNICPSSIDELIAILQVEERAFEEGFLENIIKTIKEYCTQQ